MYTALEIGLEYLPYWDESETETEAETTETTELNNIELPF
jgi:hypothetical protein